LAATVAKHRSPSAERALPWRWLQLLAGLFGFSVSISLMIRSGLGLGPWDAFHVGLHLLTGVSVGSASILVGLVIVLGTLFIGIRPGAGTIANMVLIGVFLDLLLPWVPEAPGWAWGLGYYLAALGINGFSTGLYISPALGTGPRDGLMIGLSDRLGWPVRRVRTMLELSVLGFGWWMGGAVGVGTVLFTLLIGPAAQWGLELFGVVPRGPAEEAPPHPAPQPTNKAA
jgi:uncharacterized membrane protein YczE